MSRQRRPSGTFRTASVEWKIRVQQRMDELGLTRTDLARAIGVSPEAVTQLLGTRGRPPRPSSTKKMPDIHKALRWPQPADVTSGDSDALRDELLNAWPDFDDTDRAIIELVVAKRTKK